MDQSEGQDEDLKIGVGTKLFFTIVLLVLVLLPAELLLQAHYYFAVGDFLHNRGAGPYYVADEDRCFRLRADLTQTHRTPEFAVSVFTNSRGLRSHASQKTMPYEKPSDAYRVLFLGSSMTFGWGVEFEESYPSLIADRLNVKGRRVEAINAGTPQHNLRLQNIWLKNDGYRYHPDLIVSTRVGPNLKIASSDSQDQPCHIVDEDGFLYSRFPSTFDRFTTLAKKLGIVFFSYSFYIETVANSQSDSVRDLEGAGDAAAIADPTQFETIIASYSNHVSEVREILGWNVPVAFVVIPVQFQVHASHAARWAHISDLSANELAAHSQRLFEAVESRGISVIHPLEELEREGMQE
ncbi:MAG: hypothetical protein VCE43_12375, partial [Myxococcota bacterium]